MAGPEFTLDVVRRAAGLDERSLLEALDEGVRSGMIEEIPGTGLAYRFTHELVRRALYDRLSALRRAELHLRVGHGARGRPRGDSGQGARGRGAPPRGSRRPRRRGPSDRLQPSSGAGGDGGARVRAGGRPLSDRARVWASRVRQSKRRSSSSSGPPATLPAAAVEAIEAFTAAAEIARAAGDADLLARAAIGLEDACWGEGRSHRAALELLEEASAALGEDESTLRIGLLSALARVLAYRGDHARAAIVRANAIEMARRLGDRRGLAILLARAYSARGTSHARGQSSTCSPRRGPSATSWATSRSNPRR